MCGRYVLREIAKLRAMMERLRARRLGTEPGPRYNVAPTQAMPVVINSGGLVETTMKWGLPMTAGGKPTLLINARAETAATKPRFREALRNHRCVVPADGFYEWRRHRGTPEPFFFELHGGEPFWMAGLFEETPADDARAFALLTTGPNELMAPVHDRMPVLLDDRGAAEWLAPGPLPANRLAELTQPAPAARMTARPVARTVNDARHDSPACLEPPPQGDEPMELNFG